MPATVMLPGFTIGGYQSFFGDPQRIGPLGPVTVLAGPNNSGKSNVLKALKRCLPDLRSSSLPRKLDPLEQPILEDGRDSPPFIFGVADARDHSEILNAFIGRLPKESKATHPRAINTFMQIINSSAIFDEETGLRWLSHQVIDSGLAPTPEQVRSIADSFSDDRGYFKSITLEMFNSAFEGVAANVPSFLQAWHKSIPIPDVTIIPPVREIVGEAVDKIPANRYREVRHNSGLGLPQVLQAWQAPAAEHHRLDTRRFSALNLFLQAVLEDTSVQITVPYNSDTIHISIDGRVLPLESLGAGLSQVLLISTLATWYDRLLVCIEEPELHMHPLMLRRLVKYLREQTTNQYLITTHSAHLLDDPDVTTMRISLDPRLGTIVEHAMSTSAKAAVSQHLGYRPSDLLQSNAVIWVEGPSDRIYLNYLLKAANPDLIEGIHYSIMFYGGRLLAHLTGEELEAPAKNTEEFISLLLINRKMVIVIDSDRKKDADKINETKVYVSGSFDKNGGLSWVTAGREFENYVPAALLEAAIRSIHTSTEPQIKQGVFSNQFASVVKGKAVNDTTKVKAVDKVRVAEAVVERALGDVWDILDLTQRVNAVVKYVERANDLPPNVRGGSRAAPVAPELMVEVTPAPR